MRHILTVCSSCSGADGATQGRALAQDLRRAFSAAPSPDIRGFEIAISECMSACAEPMALTFRAENKFAYLFSQIKPDDVTDILAFARLYLDSPDGDVKDARPCGRLRFCLRGRIPASGMIIPPSE